MKAVTLLVGVVLCLGLVVSQASAVTLEECAGYQMSPAFLDSLDESQEQDVLECWRLLTGYWFLVECSQSTECQEAVQAQQNQQLTNIRTVNTQTILSQPTGAALELDSRYQIYQSGQPVNPNEPVPLNNIDTIRRVENNWWGNIGDWVKGNEPHPW